MVPVATGVSHTKLIRFESDVLVELVNCNILCCSKHQEDLQYILNLNVLGT